MLIQTPGCPRKNAPIIQGKGRVRHIEGRRASKSESDFGSAMDLETPDLLQRWIGEIRIWFSDGSGNSRFGSLVNPDSVQRWIWKLRIRNSDGSGNSRFGSAMDLETPDSEPDWENPSQTKQDPLSIWKIQIGKVHDSGNSRCLV